MAGYSAIGLMRPKSQDNVGGVMRAAQIYGASLVVLENHRSRVTDLMDTMKAYRSIPCLRINNMFDACPYDCIPVGVELVESAQNIVTFKHPNRAFYIFGPEDGSLGKNHLDKCKHIIYIPTKACMNLAATVNVVLYDRLFKQTVGEQNNG